MRIVWFACCSLMIASGPIAAQPSLHEALKPPYRICAGSKTGTYSRLATALSSSCQKVDPDMILEVVDTAGSFENAGRLRTGECELALIQSDVAYLEYFNGQPFVALSQLYVEPIHIIARRELGFRTVSDALAWIRNQEERKKEGKTTRPLVIAVGASGSGSQAHALMLLGQLELSEKWVITQPLPLAKAMEGIRERKIDIAFATTAVPSQEILALPFFVWIARFTVRRPGRGRVLPGGSRSRCGSALDSGSLVRST